MYICICICVCICICKCICALKLQWIWDCNICVTSSNGWWLVQCIDPHLHPLSSHVAAQSSILVTIVIGSFFQPHISNFNYLIYSTQLASSHILATQATYVFNQISNRYSATLTARNIYNCIQILPKVKHSLDSLASNSFLLFLNPE